MKTSLSYSAPVCVTLAGGVSERFDEPYLMVADEKRVVVSVAEPGDGKSDDLLGLVKKLVPSEKPLPGFTTDFPLDQELAGVKAAHIVALVVCYMEYVHGKEPTADHIQKVAYEVEKKFLKATSHAQTLVSLKGGLFFYRKEFPFYKTALQIPAKIPPSFLKGIPAPTPLSKKLDTANYIRRLMFAAMHENEKMFRETYDPSRSDMGKGHVVQPAYEGLRRLRSR